MKLLTAAIVCALACGAPIAHAQDTTWVVKAGIGSVEPKSNNGILAGMQSSAGSDVQPIITAEWMFQPALGLEVLASTPWKHDVSLQGLGKVATTNQLPPTVSVQYHFNQGGQISPFVGVGLNWTMFWNTKTQGALTGTKLSINDSVGAALHAGVDFNIDPHWLVAIDARWISIGSSVKLNGAKIGTVNVDPMVYGLTVGYRF
jgi:outer membrane protein